MKDLANRIILLNNMIESNKNEFSEKAYKNLRFHFDSILEHLGEIMISQALYADDHEFMIPIIEKIQEKREEVYNEDSVRDERKA